MERRYAALPKPGVGEPGVVLVHGKGRLIRRQESGLLAAGWCWEPDIHTERRQESASSKVSISRSSLKIEGETRIRSP